MNARFALLSSLGMFACAGPHPTMHTALPVAQESHHMYRFDFVVTTADAGKPATSSSYTLSLEEHQRGEVHVGSNIALTPSNARQDVGLRLRCDYRFAGGDLMLSENTEISSADEGVVAIHKVSAVSEAWVVPGTPTLITSLDEPVSHKRYQVIVTATKLL